MLNAELKDTSIPVTDAEFSKAGDYRSFWTERAVARGEDIALTWHDLGDPLLIHTQPNAVPGRRYGVCTVLVPALGARLSLNGRQAAGKPWKREREGRPFSHQRAGLLRELDRRTLGGRHPVVAAFAGFPRRASTHSQGAMALLETRQLVARYGDFQALYGIDFRLGEGETVAIIGAGKSTFLKTIAGLLPAAPGNVLLAGQPIGGLPAPAIVRLGISLVP